MDLNQSLTEALAAFRAGDFTLVRDLAGAIQHNHPGEPGSLRLLGQVEYLEGNLQGAVEAFETSLKAKPEQYSLWVKLGNAQADLGAYDKAEDAYSSALKHTQDKHLALFWRAQAKAAKGATEEAWEDLSAAQEANPNFGQTYRIMGKLGHPMSKTDPFAQKLQEKLAARVLQPEDALQAHYALAGYFEAQKDVAKMWFHLHQANGLQTNRSRTWQDSYQQIITRSVEIFTKDFLATAPRPKDDFTPVFIVGLPRSGSTLLERMLAGHPEFAGAGETNIINRVIGKIQTETLLNFPNGVDFISEAQWQEFQNFYQIEAEKRVGKTRHSVDKLLSNAFFVGLILKMLPQAKIIWLKRDLMDTAFSVYKNHFWEGQSPEFCSLEGLGAYARMVEDIMEHWKTVAPDSIYEISYEDLVKTPEDTLKPALAFLGSEWDARCLDHQKTKTLSNTLSTGQVEKSLTTDAIGGGQMFKEELAPFMAAFNKESTE